MLLMDTRLLDWRPQGSRRQGRPVKRWSDDLDTFLCEMTSCGKGDWYFYAQDRFSWKYWEDSFAQSDGF